MAALDDELNGDNGYGSTASPASTSALGAGGINDEADTGTDYGGGADTAAGPANYGALIPLLQRNRTFRKMSPELQQQIISRVQQRTGGTTRDTGVPDGPEVDIAREPAASPPPSEGWGDVASRGALRFYENFRDTTAVAKGEEPKPSDVPEAEFEKPIAWGDLASPIALGKKLVFGAIRSGAQIPAGVIGAMVGGAAGTAVGGVPGAAVGGVVGSSAMMGAVAFTQELGTAYAHELQQTPDDKEGAWNRAMTTAEESGVISAASMSVFGGANLFKSMLKGQFGVSAAREAAGDIAGARAALAPTESLKSRVATQAVGQAAAVAAPTAAFNVAQGKPAGEGVVEGIPGALGNVVIDALTHGVGRLARRGRPGVTPEQEAALDATQPHPASTETPPVTGPEQMGPVMPGGQLLRREPPPEPPTGGVPPPAGGPGGAPLPPGQVPGPERFGPPTPYGPGGMQRGPEGVPAPAEGVAGRQRLLPEAPPVTPEAPVLEPSRMQQRFGAAGEEPVPGAAQAELPPRPEPPPPPAPEPPPEPPPTTGPSRIQERFGVEPPIAEAPLRPETVPGPRSRIQERFGTPESWITEPDDLHPGQHVAKDVVGGEVIGKGASPKEALGDAVTRKGEPYAPEAGEVKPAPAEAAAAAPRAEAAPAPTKAEEVKAKGVARQAKAKAAAEPKVADAQLGHRSTEELKTIRDGIKLLPKSEVNTQLAERVDAELARRDETAKAEVTTGRKSEGLGKAKPTNWEAKGRDDARKGIYDPPTGPPSRKQGYDYSWEAELAGDVPAAQRRTVAEARLAEKAAAAETRTKGGAFTMGEGQEIAAKPTPRKTSQMAREARAESQGLGQTLEGGSSWERGVRSKTYRGKVGSSEEAVGGSELPKGGYDRKGRVLVEKLLDKSISVEKAYEYYGEQKPAGARGGEGGRPRTSANLTEFVREAVEAAKDPNIEEGLKARLAQADVELATLKGAAKVRAARAARLDIEEQLKHETRVKRRQADVQALLSELEARERGNINPSAYRAGTGSQFYQALEREATASKARRSDINEPLLKILESKERTNLYSYLDHVINDVRTRALLPGHVALARVLRRILPDLEIRNRAGTADAWKTDIGQYMSSGHIELHSEHLRTAQGRGINSTIAVVLHEALHGATLDYISRLYSRHVLTPTELAHKQALEAISREVSSIVARSDLKTGMRLSPIERGQLEYSSTLYEGQPHEVITQIFSSPEVMGVLAKIPASAELKATLDSIGMGGRQVSSLWSAFKNTIRRIFNLNAVSDTVLDHVMRPLSEITEAGARYRASDDIKFRLLSRQIIRKNAQVIDSSPEARSAFSLRDLQLGTRGANTGDVVQRSATQKLFSAATLDAIHDFVKPILPGVTEHRQARERVAETTRNEVNREIVTKSLDGREIRETNLDKTIRLRQAILKGPDGKALSELMTKATLADVRLGANADNTHLATDAERNVLSKLQQEFAALHPSAQQTYRELRDQYREWYRTERRAGLKSVVEYAMPDLDAAGRQSIVDQLQTHQGVMDFINGPDQTALAQKLGAKWENKKDLIHEIAELQRAGMVQGDYFPLRRYGEYVISYGKAVRPEPGKPYGVEMFETWSEANNRRAELVASGRDDVSQIFNKAMGNQRKALVAHQALNTLDNAMIKSGLGDEAQTVVRDLYAGQLIQQGTRMATATMRREGIPGASTDQARNLLNDFMAYTSRLGHLEHGGEVINSLFRMEKAANALHAPGSKASRSDTIIAQAAIHELRERLSPVDGDSSSDLIGKGARGLTTMSFLYNLMRPAQIVMQLADTHVTASSILGSRHGVGAVGAISRAMAELTGTAMRAAGRNGARVLRDELHSSNWDLSQVYRDRLKQVMNPLHADLLINRLNQAGLIDYTKTRELRRMAGPKGWGGPNFISKALDLWSAGEHAVDSASRAAIGKAAFELELSRTKNVDLALDYAEQMARDTQPNYNSYNKSRIATGNNTATRLIAPLMFQFKQYGLHMYGVQGNLIAKAVREGGAERRQALAALGLLQGSHALLAGVNTAIFGSLPMMVGLGVYDAIFGDGKQPYTNAQLDLAVRNWAYDTGGKTFSEMFSKGVPAALGIDAHRSLQFSNLLGVADLKSWDTAGYADFALKTMLGAAGETSVNLVTTAQEAVRGDWHNAQKLMPRMPRDIIDATLHSIYGVKDAKGNLTIVPPEKLSMYDWGIKAAGFNPTAVTTPRDARAGIKLEEDVSNARKDTILDRLITATDKKPIYEEILRHNQAYPDDPITGQSIQRRFREQARINAQPGLFGMRVPQRDVKNMMNVGRFANG